MFEDLSWVGKGRLEAWTQHSGDADFRAFLLCCRILPDRELIRLLEDQCVHVKKLFRTYVIRGYDYPVRTAGGARWCVYARAVTNKGYAIPPLDVVASFYLALKYEPYYKFALRANRL